MNRTVALQFLLERLNWPLRQVKACAAREIAELLVNPECKSEVQVAFLEWLSKRRLESQVLSGLAVLCALKPNQLPPYELVDAAINCPSILSANMLASIYELDFLKLELVHSGAAPADFVPGTYFNDYVKTHSPPLFSNNLNRLERKTKHPFLQQWAFEQKAVTEATGSIYSGYPHHFFEAGYNNAGVTGSFHQRQGDVFLSAYLRVLAFAVVAWGMPPNLAIGYAVDALPTQRGLIDIEPVARPTWIGTIPEDCCAEGAPLEQLVRTMLAAARGTGMRPVYLSTPVWRGSRAFADLTVRAHMVSPGYSGLDDSMISSALSMFWEPTEPICFEGPLSTPPVREHLKSTATGIWAPLTLDLWSVPLGLWHADYLQRGLQVPAPYCFDSELSLRCHEGGISILCQENIVASWCTWNDHWIPLYPIGGASACATMLEIRECDVERTLKQHGFILGWSVELRQWARDNDYGEFKLSSRAAFFRE